MNDNPSMKEFLGIGKKAINVLGALNDGSQAVPEVAPVYTGGAAAHLAGMHPQAEPTNYATPFYVPPVQVDDDELMKQAEIKATFTLAKMRLGSSVTRNLVAEMIVKVSDHATIDEHERSGGGEAEPGSSLSKAYKRVKMGNRLKDYKSMITSDDSELVELLKEAIFLDLVEQRQRGTYKKMSADEMISKMMTTEIFGFLEVLAEPAAELAKASIAKK